MSTQENLINEEIQMFRDMVLRFLERVLPHFEPIWRHLMSNQDASLDYLT